MFSLFQICPHTFLLDKLMPYYFLLFNFAPPNAYSLTYLLLLLLLLLLFDFYFGRVRL